MRILTSFFVMCLMVLAISCSTVTVDYDYDPAADFARFKSYSWFPVPRENIRYDLLIKQIKSAMERELDVRGFSMVPDDPDFFIALHGGIQPRMSYEDWQYVYEYYEPYWAKRRVDITKYIDQQLIVDFIDSKSKELVYRAIATAFVPEPTPEERKKTIDDAITKILKNFTPVQ